MRSWVRHGATVLALAASTGLAAAQGRATADTTATTPFTLAADDDTTGSLGTIGLGAREIVPLSDEQRDWIFLGVINLPDVPDADVTTLGMTTPGGASGLSNAVVLQDLPAMVTRKIPLVGNYKFVKLEDRILLVNPDSREVVAEIPRYKLVR
jgi:hypothetical protein